jgi:hypothetical protein
MKRSCGGFLDSPGEVLEYVARVLESLDVPYAVGGSTAAILYGEPRYTRDIDIVVELPVGRVSRLLEHFAWPEFIVDAGVAREAAVEHGQFNIIHKFSGVKVDIYVADDEIARNQIANARRLTTADGVTAEISSPEELMLKKMQFYAYGEMETQLRDVASMLRVSGPHIDREKVRLLAERYNLSHVWEAVLKRVETD